MSENTPEVIATWNVSRSPEALGAYVAKLTSRLDGLDDLGV